MSRESYLHALEQAVAEWNELTAQRQALDQRIAQLTQTIASLNKLCGFEATVPLGLTDACRMVLRNAGQPLTVAEIRSQLEAVGIDLERYASGLTAIHTVLKRLRDAGDVRFVPRSFGKPAYEWARLTTVVIDARPDTGRGARVVDDVAAARTKRRRQGSG